MLELLSCHLSMSDRQIDLQNRDLRFQLGLNEHNNKFSWKHKVKAIYFLKWIA